MLDLLWQMRFAAQIMNMEGVGAMNRKFSDLFYPAGYSRHLCRISCSTSQCLNQLSGLKKRQSMRLSAVSRHRKVIFSTDGQGFGQRCVGTSARAALVQRGGGRCSSSDLSHRRTARDGDALKERQC